MRSFVWDADPAIDLLPARLCRAREVERLQRSAERVPGQRQEAGSKRWSWHRTPGSRPAALRSSGRDRSTRRATGPRPRGASGGRCSTRSICAAVSARAPAWVIASAIQALAGDTAALPGAPAPGPQLRAERIDGGRDVPRGVVGRGGRRSGGRRRGVRQRLRRLKGISAWGVGGASATSSSHSRGRPRAGDRRRRDASGRSARHAAEHISGRVPRAPLGARGTFRASP